MHYVTTPAVRTTTRSRPTTRGARVCSPLSTAASRRAAPSRALLQQLDGNRQQLRRQEREHLIQQFDHVTEGPAAIEQVGNGTNQVAQQHATARLSGNGQIDRAQIN